VLALIGVSQIQVGTSLWLIGAVLAINGLAIGLAQQSPVIGLTAAILLRPTLIPVSERAG
jgi:hypothetical protein